MHASRIDSFRTAIAGSRNRLVSHPVYSRISNIDDLRTFMEFHVYAVWDFMSLLKKLQLELTCVTIPWMPKGSAATRYLINEIVTGEESDVDLAGNRISHFELYLQAMHQAGCDLHTIDTFSTEIAKGNSVSSALRSAKVAEGASRFVENTFAVISSNKPHIIAGVFTFGREDLIPDMFLQLIRGLKEQFPDTLDLLQYYIERHIEVDGGHHGELALQMTAALCGHDDQKWKECEAAVIEALDSRARLWDAIVASIEERSSVMQ